MTKGNKCALLLIMAALLAVPLLAHGMAEKGSPAELYRTACAACHGADGRGASADLVGFDLPLPDFTDCSFATREPDADWVAVAHQGGPVRGFSELMPAFGEVLTLEELATIVEYIRGFCAEEGWPRGELNLPRPLHTGKAYPEDEAVFSTAVTGEDPGTIASKLVLEKRFGDRNQFEIVLPFGWREIEDEGASGWSSNLGDVAVGFKRTVCHSLERGSILSVAAEVILPTGDEDSGFGKGTLIIEPFVSWGKLLPAEFFVQAQTGFELPMRDEKAENEAFLRLAFGRTFTSGRFGRSWSPMAELLAGRELTSGEDIEWDVVPQIQITLNRRQHIMLNVGVRTPLNNSSERDTTVVAYLLWDWFDGGFLQGW
jgi:hypothetical protein